MQGQRIIIVGDSTMRQVFQSLACILHEDVEDGYLVVRSPHLPLINYCNSFIVAANCNLWSSSHWPAHSMTMIGKEVGLLRHPRDVAHGHLVINGSHLSLLSIIWRVKGNTGRIPAASKVTGDGLLSGR